MTASTFARWTIGVVGSLLVLMNAFHMTMGFGRLQKALREDPIPTKLAEPLQTAWLLTGSVLFSLGAILLWLLPDVAAGSAGATKAAMGVGATLVFAGVASYFATRKHPGMLVFSVFGLVVLIPLWLARA